METTKHILARMSQRGISMGLLEKVLEFGDVECGEKIVLNKKLGLRILKELDRLRKDILKIVDKGGITLVVDGGVLITAYNVDSFKRGKF